MGRGKEVDLDGGCHQSPVSVSKLRVALSGDTREYTVVQRQLT